MISFDSAMLTPVFGSTKYGTCKKSRNQIKILQTLFGICDDFTNPQPASAEIICDVVHDVESIFRTTNQRSKWKLKSYMWQWWLDGHGLFLGQGVICTSSNIPMIQFIYVYVLPDWNNTYDTWTILGRFTFETLRQKHQVCLEHLLRAEVYKFWSSQK